MKDSPLRQYGPLALAALCVIAGQWLWPFYDSLSLALLVIAAGLFWSSHGWKPRAAALAMTAAALFWSSLDPKECSAWWRGRVVFEKAAGHLPYLGWGGIQSFALGPCRSYYKAEPEVMASVNRIAEKSVADHRFELYETPLGNLWIEAPGKKLLAWLVWELTRQEDYESQQVQIQPGDTVIDCGAHVGTFARYALARGAGRVVAIEPDATNLEMLEANLAEEIAAGRVLLIRAGVWDQRTVLTLTRQDGNSAAHTFVRTVADGTKIEGMPVLTLDQIVAEHGVDRVDFIKMDIEGAERRALAGARDTLRRFKPRMAISSYHMWDDPQAIPAVVRGAQPAYLIHAKDFERGPWRLITKVLFFH